MAHDDIGVLCIARHNEIACEQSAAIKNPSDIHFN